MFRTGIVFILFALALIPGQAQAFTALLDPGHGGYETGIVYTVPGASALNEKDIDLAVARSCAQALGGRGVPTLLTRDSDRFMAISNRLTYAGSKRPSVFISIHMSSDQDFKVYSSSGANSTDPVYLFSSNMKQSLSAGESKKLAEAMIASLKEAFPDKNASYVPVPLPLLNGLAIPAIIVEVPHPANFNYSNAQLREQVSAAIVTGITRYLNPAVNPFMDPLTGRVNGTQ